MGRSHLRPRRFATRANIRAPFWGQTGPASKRWVTSSVGLRRSIAGVETAVANDGEWIVAAMREPWALDLLRGAAAAGAVAGATEARRAQTAIGPSDAGAAPVAMVAEGAGVAVVTTDGRAGEGDGAPRRPVARADGAGSARTGDGGSGTDASPVAMVAEGAGVAVVAAGNRAGEGDGAL